VPNVRSILRNEPSAVLLTVQLAGVLLYPFMVVVSRLVALTVPRRSG